MKRTVIFLALALLGFQAQSQETYLDLLLNYTPTKFNFGDDNGELKEFRKNLWGFQGGLSFQAGVTEHFSIVPELYYFNKGVRLEENNLLTLGETKIRLRTIEMPSLARVHYKNFYVNAGPTIGYNFGGKIEVEGNENVPSQKVKLNFDDVDGGFKRWDAGLQFGIGYDFKLKNGSRISLDTRYHYGLTNIAQSGEIYNRYFYTTLLWSKKWKKNPLSKLKN
jgi:hypothetical protein